jgi:hypothetical protein
VCGGRRLPPPHADVEMTFNTGAAHPYVDKVSFEGSTATSSGARIDIGESNPAMPDALMRSRRPAGRGFRIACRGTSRETRQLKSRRVPGPREQRGRHR